MLSYMITTQDTAASTSDTKSTAQRNLNLNLATHYDAALAAAAGDAGIEPTIQEVSELSSDERTQLLSAEAAANATTQHYSAAAAATAGDANNRDTDNESLDISKSSDKTQQSKKAKMTKLGAKNVGGLKRVSFGSSKGSMVETLVFETPTPLSEKVEPSFAFQAEPALNNSQQLFYSKTNMDDSGIEIQEESERSKVRVSIYQSNQPQQICPPEYITRFEDNLDNAVYNYFHTEDMTAATTIPSYERQQSTDSGWDNPFRPGGDLSREADEIVNMIRGGKPITPTEDYTIGSRIADKDDNCNGTSVVENVTKSSIVQSQSAQNGTNSHKAQSSNAKPLENNGITTSSAQVSKQVVPGPTSASHVVIDEKKSKKKGCCVLQ